MNLSNGRDLRREAESKALEENLSYAKFFCNGHIYHIENAWKTSSICLDIVEHACKEILRPSYFLDALMAVFVPRVVSKLVRHNIALAIFQKRLYAVRKLQSNQWLGIHILSKNHLGDSVVLDEHGNIIRTIQRSPKHQKRINSRRRPDTKIIAALYP
ncbi:MAG: hypothetical protein ACE5R6_01680 [Candidatus Heimdallarchaeota archaeon]